MKTLEKAYAKRIASEYAPKNDTKVVQLKKLDAKVKKPAEVVTYIMGTLGALIAGTGMSMVMTDFGPKGIMGLILGIVIGVIGFAICLSAYPVYNKILGARKAEYAGIIIALAEQIEKE